MHSGLPEDSISRRCYLTLVRVDMDCTAIRSIMNGPQALGHNIIVLNFIIFRRIGSIIDANYGIPYEPRKP